MLGDGKSNTASALYSLLQATETRSRRRHGDRDAALETEVPRSAVADLDHAIFDDFLSISMAFLQVHQDALRPNVDLRFLAEFVMRAVSATANDYGLRAPDRLDDPQLEQALIEMVARYLLKDDRARPRSLRRRTALRAVLRRRVLGRWGLGPNAEPPARRLAALGSRRTRASILLRAIALGSQSHARQDLFSVLGCPARGVVCVRGSHRRSPAPGRVCPAWRRCLAPAHGAPGRAW